jgi:hypothetical protein
MILLSFPLLHLLSHIHTSRAMCTSGASMGPTASNCLWKWHVNGGNNGKVSLKEEEGNSTINYGIYFIVLVMILLSFYLFHLLSPICTSRASMGPTTSNYLWNYLVNDGNDGKGGLKEEERQFNNQLWPCKGKSLCSCGQICKMSTRILRWLGNRFSSILAWHIRKDIFDENYQGYGNGVVFNKAKEATTWSRIVEKWTQCKQRQQMLARTP